MPRVCAWGPALPVGLQIAMHTSALIKNTSCGASNGIHYANCTEERRMQSKLRVARRSANHIEGISCGTSNYVQSRELTESIHNAKHTEGMQYTQQVEGIQNAKHAEGVQYTEQIEGIQLQSTLRAYDIYRAK
eukprot:scaffold255502_cov30-Tisochrysis_lutea.AAC.1